ncbi:MAG: CPBP family intramembrane metalloprotease [Clostridia bacterium]|nr:CPBP family intramembrane metalloprotease [Clostridia bacterium]
MKTNNTNIPEYTSYPKQFAPYKWYKPLLEIILATAAIFIVGLIIGCAAIGAARGSGVDIKGIFSGGYDDLNIYSTLGAIVTLAPVAMMLPGTFIGIRLVNSRPFSSISSSRGGFDFKLFFKCIVPALILVGIPCIIYTVMTCPRTDAIKFTVPGFILCTILAPMQCVGEEYTMRGLLMQTFGSWIKIPLVAMLMQAIVFMLIHPYNVTGMISVGITGLILGFIAYRTHGLEAGSALHIVNNMISFYFLGFGFESTGTEVSFADMAVSVGVCALYLVFIIYADKKLGWFDNIIKDDVSGFNAKYEERKARKAAKKG